MDCTENITVAFSGHRTYRGEVEEELCVLIGRLYDEGYRRFLCGMAWGFDLAAGEAVAELKRRKMDVALVAVVPYDGFRGLFHGEDGEQYDRVVAVADEVVVVSECEPKLAFRMRNNFLVDNASVVVAWFNGMGRGGTAYTVKRARKRGVKVENLYPSSQLELAF
jgi:uncharacterized phage-like protein YoqJ